jgi:tetratricopeptide (TPR) repeat protein
VLVYADLVARRLARGEPVSDLLAEARAMYPTNCVLLYLEGRLRTQQGELDLAIGCFDQLVSVDVSTFPPDSPGYDERLFGDLAHAGRALALFRAGRFADAAEAYGVAASLMPSEPEYAVKRQLAEARARASAGHSPFAAT